MIDSRAIFPKIWGILGWNIYLYHSHLDVTPNENAHAQNWSVAWHQDSMRVNDEIESDPRPRLSLKVGYYLTDVNEPGRGNTLIVPGSHTQNEIELDQDGHSNPSGAEPVCVPAGGAVIIDRRIWHSRSANRSDRTRKVVWYGYSYRWLRPKDAMTVEHLYPQLDPSAGRFSATVYRRMEFTIRLTVMSRCGLGFASMIQMPPATRRITCARNRAHPQWFEAKARDGISRRGAVDGFWAVVGRGLALGRTFGCRVVVKTAPSQSRLGCARGALV